MSQPVPGQQGAESRKRMADESPATANGATQVRESILTAPLRMPVPANKMRRSSVDGKQSVRKGPPTPKAKLRTTTPDKKTTAELRREIEKREREGGGCFGIGVLKISKI